MTDSTAPTAPPTFDELSLSSEVRQAVDELGYVHPTPVQRAVFEPATRGLDLVVQARTGTGKTAAFGLPIVDSLVRRGTKNAQAIILCPTRELALQVSRELSALSKYRGVSVTAVYGGAPMGKQVQAIQDGAQVVVGTPGRVLDHLRRDTLNPKTLRIVVLDESDEMLSMGFLPQITEILGYIPEARQTLMFSATLAPDIQRIAETKLKNPEFITLSGDQIGALEIDHFVYFSANDKTADLIRILEVDNPESAIIFSNTRDDTKRVAGALQQQGYDADWLNADLSQSERETVMARTRQGKLRFLVATDVAARGIDISHLTHVINYDFPESAEQYVHRTGRTGRAGRTGTAISLLEPSDIGNLYILRLTYKIQPLERQLPSRQDLKTRAELDVVEMFATHFSSQKITAKDRDLAKRLLTHDDAERIIAGLLRDHLGARPEGPEAASAARRARPPAPAPDPKSEEDGSRRRRGRRPRTDDEIQERQADPRRADDERNAPRRDQDERPRSGARPGGGARRENRRSEPRGEPSTPTPAGEASTQERAASGKNGATRTRVQDPEHGPTRSAPDRDAVAEIYVNVGRKDGAKASDIYDVLKQRGGVSIDDTEYVNVRHHHCFVGVYRPFLDRALEALDGAEIAGRTAAAEPSRSKP